jgi:hypothetical protein
LLLGLLLQMLLGCCWGFWCRLLLLLLLLLLQGLLLQGLLLLLQGLLLRGKAYSLPCLIPSP